MRIVDPILKELDQEAATTRRVLERVPDDKLGWKPHPKSMSSGQLSLHVAQTPGTIAGFVTGPTREISGASRNRISVVRTIMLSHWYHHRWQLSVYPARAQRAGAGDLWAQRGRESFRMRH
jgi:hypothetical protein